MNIKKVLNLNNFINMGSSWYLLCKVLTFNYLFENKTAGQKA